MNSISWTTTAQLLALLLSSGVLTLVIYQLRVLGLPDKAVPAVAHATGIGVTILIAICDALATGHPLTVQVVLAAILAGVTGSFTASGIHGQVTGLAKKAPPPPQVHFGHEVQPKETPPPQPVT